MTTMCRPVLFLALRSGLRPHTRSGTRRRIHPPPLTARVAIPAACAAVLLTACKGPLDPAGSIAPTLEELRQVDEVNLESYSRSPPGTVEEATRQTIEQLAERPAPPATLDLTLADVRGAALANNLDLQVQLVAPAIAEASVDREQAKFESTFFGSARHTDTDSPTEFATESSQADIDAFDLGVSIPLRTGGTLTLDAPLGRSDTNNAFSLLNPAYNTSLAFSISQNLLRGAGIETNEFSIYAAESERTIVNAQTRLEAIRILANADRSYWLLYAARRDLEVARQRYDLARQQLQSARHKVDAGDAPELEVTRAESGLAESLETILVADTVLSRRQRDMKLFMNRPDLPMESATELVTATEPNPLHLDLDPVQLGEIAVANRMEMLELELRLALDAATIRFERNAALPLLVLDYSYSLNGLTGSYGDSYSQIRDSRFNDWTVALRAEVPIGNEAAKARVHEAVLARVQRLATREQRKGAILQEVYNAVDLLEQNWQRILAARAATILAGRTLQGEQRQFEVGVRTSTDVLDAATRLAEAQFREVQALTDYEIARVDIAFGTGTLLGYGKVRWAPIDVPEDKNYLPKPRYGDDVPLRGYGAEEAPADRVGEN